MIKKHLALGSLVLVGGTLLASCGVSGHPTATVPHHHSQAVSKSTPAAASSISSTTPPAPSTAHTTGPLNDLSLHMTSSQQGWAWSATGFYHTATGGQKWTPSKFILSHRAQDPWVFNQFLSLPHGMLMTVALRHTHTQGDILVTGTWAAASREWIWHQETLPASVLAPFPGNDPQMVSFATPQNGWAFFNGAASTSLDAGCLYRTTNGGRTWTRLAPVIRPGSLTGISAQSATSVWMSADINLVGMPAAATQPDSILYHSITGGQTWVTAPAGQSLLPGLNGAQAEQYIATPPVWWSNTVGEMLRYTWSAHTRLTLEHTHNGGTTWVPTHILTIPGVVTPQWNMPTFSQGVMLLGSTLEGTWTSGQSWQSIPLPNALQQALIRHNISVSIAFLSPQEGWIVTQNNDGVTLYKTSTAGKQWTTIHPDVSR